MSKVPRFARKDALPSTLPLPGCSGGETLPLPWVYRVLSAALPAEASVEVEAIQLIAASAGEYVALLFQQAASSGGGVVDAAGLFRAQRELGYGSHEELLHLWRTAALLAQGASAAAAAVAPPLDTAAVQAVAAVAEAEAAAQPAVVEAADVAAAAEQQPASLPLDATTAMLE